MIQLLNLEAVVCRPLSSRMTRLWVKLSLSPIPKSDTAAWTVIESVDQRMSNASVEVEAAANSLRKRQNASKTRTSKFLVFFIEKSLFNGKSGELGAKCCSFKMVTARTDRSVSAHWPISTVLTLTPASFFLWFQKKERQKPTKTAWAFSYCQATKNAILHKWWLIRNESCQKKSSIMTHQHA